MKTIIIRPSVDSQYSEKAKELTQAFDDMSLVNVTVVEDRAIYIFGDKRKSN